MTTRYYLQSTNADTSCDSSSVPLDLSKTQGSPTTQAVSINSDVFGEVASFDTDVSGDTPSTGVHGVSISVNAIDANAEGRFRVQVVNSSCTVTQNSAYSATFTTSGVKTLTTGSLTWASENRLRVSFELRRASGHGTVNATLDVQHASSYIDAPWTAATFVQVPKGQNINRAVPRAANW